MIDAEEEISRLSGSPSSTAVRMLQIFGRYWCKIVVSIAGGFAGLLTLAIDLGTDLTRTE